MVVLISKNSNLFWSMSGYHFHDLYEINLVLTGEASFVVADRLYQASPGTLLLLGPTDLHKSASVSGKLYERYVLHFPPESAGALTTRSTNLMDCFDNRPPDFSHCLQLPKSDLPRLTALFEKAVRLQDSNEYGADVRRSLVLAEILLCVNELAKNTVSNVPLSSGPAMGRVMPVLKFIQENLNGDLSLDTLAKVAFMSKHHFSTVFKEATGFTPNEYVIHRRIMKARELLKERKLSVQLVGEAVGFRNNSHFIRTFTKLVGTSPKQYSLRQQALPLRQSDRVIRGAVRA